MSHILKTLWWLQELIYLKIIYKHLVIVNCTFLQLVVTDKTQNLRRLEAQRNELNAKGMQEILNVD